MSERAAADAVPDLEAAGPDAACLRRFVHDQSQEAFAQLVERHGAMVRSACREQLGVHHPWLDDATQAVFLILARRACDIRQAEALPAWLRVTARGVVANIHRAESRRHRREQLVGAAAGEISPVATSSLEQADLRARLEQAIAALTPAQREAVVRHFLQDKPQAIVASELGVSEGAVKKRISDAMGHLRSFFRDPETALPSLLALSTGRDEGLAPQLLERCIASGRGAGSARALQLSRPRTWWTYPAQLLSAGVAVLAILACGWWLRPHPHPISLPRSDPAPAVVAAAQAPTAVQDPAAEAILGPIRALRRNDLATLLELLPAQDRTRFASAWQAFATHPEPFSDALANAGLSMVDRPRAVEELLPLYRPLTADLLVDLRQLSARAQAAGRTAQAALLATLARQLHGYLTTIDVHDPTIARAVVERSLATGRMWPFRTMAGARALSFPGAVLVCGRILSSVKSWWLPYGLDVDHVLDSVQVDSISGDGPRRVAHLSFIAFHDREHLDLVITQQQGLWTCNELTGAIETVFGEVSHYFYLPAALQPTQPQPLAVPSEPPSFRSGSPPAPGLVRLVPQTNG